MQCAPRAETPENLAGATLFPASDILRFVPGQIFNADGGATHP
jgi:hypothetical protein